jgi:hypothetical protein
MGLLPHAAFIVASLAGVVGTFMVVTWLESVSEIKEFTAMQYGMALWYILSMAVWIGAEAGFFVVRHQPRYDAVDNELEDEEGELVQEKGSRDTDSRVGIVYKSQLPALRAWGEFVLYMGYVYLCDRTTVFAKGPKQTGSLRFWGVNVLILLAALCTLRSSGAVGEVTKPLQRDQTEEWKGWMQLMFILYHYFAEAPIYNAIRVYIAAYVWMTGFGNFSYYYVKADFTLLRFAQMMWRLNFFVFFVCATMNNEYMLYYICAMHTFFTWMVYLPLYFYHHLNQNDKVCALKIFLALCASVLLYDVPGVFHTVFEPFTFLLGFHDPLHPEFTDALHEWFFRSGLDHLVWVFGMLCAFLFPWFDKQLQMLEELPSPKQTMYKAALIGLTLALSVWYTVTFFLLPKREYNKVHPFTSFIPIWCYMVLRNCSPTLRRWHMHLFAWCGKVTLETYILQFHIWMKSTGINGSPKFLMVWLPGWFYTNFLLTTVVFIFVSYRIFKITVVLRDACIPRDGSKMFQHAVGGAVALLALYACGVGLKG